MYRADAIDRLVVFRRKLGRALGGLLGEAFDVFTGERHQERVEGKDSYADKRQLPVYKEENGREDEELEDIQGECVKNLYNAGNGLIHVPEAREYLACLSFVKEAEVQSLNVLVEAGLVIVADIHANALAEIPAQQLTAADAHG